MKMTKKEIGWFRYWCRIRHIPFDVWGKGDFKDNPIKVKSRKK